MKALTDVFGETSQQEPMIGRTDQVKNDAGGYVFKSDPMQLLDRFLILGTEGGTYYCDEKKHTKLNAEAVIALIKRDGGQAVLDRAVEVSTQGLAPKNDYAIFVLALCMTYGSPEVKQRTKAAFPQICRIGTHVFQFCSYLVTMRRWGKVPLRAVQSWYTNKEGTRLAYQLVKYRNREGWTHRDVLCCVHPKLEQSYTSTLLKWVTQPEQFKAMDKSSMITSLGLDKIYGFEELQTLKKDKDVARFLELPDRQWITHEMVPSEVRGVNTWRQLVENGMPMAALLRNLPTLTRLGVLVPMGDLTQQVIEQLTNQEALHKARVHPISILIAKLTYESGTSIRGDAEWDPIDEVSDALERMMQLAFKSLTAIDRRVYLGIDVSGSMAWATLMGVPGFTPAMASAALAVCLAKQCARTVVKGFASELRDLGITKQSTITSAVRAAEGQSFGQTDCAAPMLDALEKGIPVDCFVILTDNQTWVGNVHPTRALAQYRKKMGIPAKLITVAMTATEITIADPTDPQQYDVVGFNANLPKMIETCIG